MSVELGNYLYECRIEQNITQKELTDTLGYKSPQFVSNVERGICQPARKTIGKYVSAVKGNKATVFRIISDDFNKKLWKDLK